LGFFANETAQNPAINAVAEELAAWRAIFLSLYARVRGYRKRQSRGQSRPLVASSHVPHLGVEEANTAVVQDR
jgi:hypothetical protein